MGSEGPIVDPEDDLLDLGIFDVGVILLLEASTEEGGEGLVEVGLEAPHEDLDELEACLLALAVDELDEHLALTEGELAHARGILVEEALLDGFEVGLAGLLVGDGEEVLVGLDDDAAHLAGYGEGLLDVADVAPVEALLSAATKLGRAVDVDVGEVYDGDGVALVDVHGEAHRLAVGLCRGRCTMSEEEEQCGDATEMCYEVLHYVMGWVRTVCKCGYTSRSPRDGEGLGCGAEDGGLRLGEVEDLDVGVVGTVEGGEVGMGLDHAHDGFVAGVEVGLTGDAHPVVATHGGDLDLGVGLHLVGHVLAVLGHDVELAIIEVDGAEGTHACLVAVHGGQVVDLGLFEEVVYSLHGGIFDL